MMTSCMKTLVWSFLLCFTVMSMWSILAVELLNDIVAEMRTEGYWSDCDECGRYFTSVMHSNLYIFQTIIAGDSWGKMAVPVSEKHPWAAIIFCGALLTIIFGVLNLVVAVVVDTFAERRLKDTAHMAAELEFEERSEKRELSKLFEQIDKDNSGDVTYEELEDAAGRVPAFRQKLRVLDIDQEDLQQLFAIIDRDGSGEIDPEEFIETLYRVKNTESKTATRLIKHYLMHMLPLIQKEQDRAKENFEDLRATRRNMETGLSEIRDLLPQIETRQLVFEKGLSNLFRSSSETESQVNDIKSQISKHEDAIKQELVSIGRYVMNALERPPLPISTKPTPLPSAATPAWNAPGRLQGLGRAVTTQLDGSSARRIEAGTPHPGLRQKRQEVRIRGHSDSPKADPTPTAAEAEVLPSKAATLPERTAAPMMVRPGRPPRAGTGQDCAVRRVPSAEMSSPHVLDRRAGNGSKDRSARAVAGKDAGDGDAADQPLNVELPWVRSHSGSGEGDLRRRQTHAGTQPGVHGVEEARVMAKSHAPDSKPCDSSVDESIWRIRQSKRSRSRLAQVAK